MLDKKALRTRIFDKLLEIHTEEMDKLKETFIEHIREVNAMSREELEQMDKDLLNALHKEKTRL